jgi:hypothetical protein
MILRLAVESRFCGPVSVGTVSLIRLIMDRCGYGLVRSKDYVDRAVFGGETVDIPLPSDVDGEKLLLEIITLETPAIFHASLGVGVE